MINFCQPSVGDEELAAVGEVFASNWLGNGRRAADFETAFAAHIGRPASEVVAVTSCTEGLFQAVAALDLAPGDEVVLPTISFVGAAHAVRAAGGRVVLCDVDPLTLNPTVDHVERKLTSATKAVLILHYAGDPGEVADLAALAADRSITFIEDAACGLGSSIAGTACGTFGDIGVWSFDAMKLMTTGDGGTVWCHDERVAERIRITARVGVGSSGFDRRTTSGRWWEVEPCHVGRRAAMNDVAAAVGLVQLRRLPEFLERRRAVAAMYERGLEDVASLRTPPPRAPDVAWTFYPVHVDGRRDSLAAHLLERGVYCNFRYWPLHRTAMYHSDGLFPGADEAAATTLLLPLHAALSDDDVDRVMESIGGFDRSRP